MPASLRGKSSGRVDWHHSLDSPDPVETATCGSAQDGSPHQLCRVSNRGPEDWFGRSSHTNLPLILAKVGCPQASECAGSQYGCRTPLLALSGVKGFGIAWVRSDPVFLPVAIKRSQHMRQKRNRGSAGAGW